MPTNYLDQFYQLDPAYPPPPGTAVAFVKLTLTDQNDDDDLDRFNGDSLDGVDIIRSWPGDTVTINVPGIGNITYTGTTFYLADGRRFFTPTDGQVLRNGTFVSSTYVTTQGPLLVSQLGPPCFTAGTLIDTPAGPVRVEDLRPGDMVMTLDHGAQPLRWVGGRTVCGLGRFAPVELDPGVFDNDRSLLLSPEHRILWRGWEIELFFAETEALVAARHLVGLPGIRLRPMTRVSYLHLLFDRHEIVRANGAWSESLHPGGWMIQSDPLLRDEISALCPEVLARLPEDCPGARRILTAKEARVLHPQRSRIAAMA